MYTLLNTRTHSGDSSIGIHSHWFRCQKRYLITKQLQEDPDRVLFNGVSGFKEPQENNLFGLRYRFELKKKDDANAVFSQAAVADGKL